MLKASSSGIGIVLTLRRRLALTPTTIITDSCRGFLQVQSRNSSDFAARFAGQLGKRRILGDGPSSSISREVQGRKKVKGYAPLVRAAPKYGPVGSRTLEEGGEEVRKAEQSGKPKGKHMSGASKIKRHVRSSRSSPRRGRAKRAKKAVYVQSENLEVVPDSELQTLPELPMLDDSVLNLQTQSHSKLDVYSLLDDRQIEDLSVPELRALIFHKGTDLMQVAWDAYQRLVSIEMDENILRERSDNKDTDTHDDPLTTVRLLATLANRLIAERKNHRKNSREIFLRLLSVYARLRRERGQAEGVPYLMTAEWNALIHCAGTGLRGRLSLEAYNAALDVHDDMLRGVGDAKLAGYETLVKEVEPDIYTYTTLLNIALRSEHQPAIDHAMKLLEDSKKEPTRITHLCMMRYRYRLEGLSGARAVLAQLHPEEIGSDGITAYLTCAGNEGDLNVIEKIYNALRRNIQEPEHNNGTSSTIQVQDDASNASESSDDVDKYVSVEGIRFPRTLGPSEAVYNYVIQIFAYHGRLLEALQIFTEMLETRHPSPSSSSSPDKGGFFQPNYAVFRALFLGFARHSHMVEKRRVLAKRLIEGQTTEWTWDRFCVLLDTFLGLGETITPSERMVFWIMIAVKRLTGDEQLLRQTWHKLTSRWHIRKGGRLKVLDLKYGSPVEEAVGEHGKEKSIV
ncbi:uncharacterized protein FOMMEDRAFT_169591 [Fomitiporia mediterranea MF3/22]|uniref:uncharacterized protein n=1 Tax=Fomitiporia mediterranea (strain MF3/22) TaxID=694068 RepID=UPI0004407B9B|nr:uncharacterized protein FOMMEDRAFT_169591 [Fomitiporia mediterranea MF3/22]EJD01479.1 hypothetical protein FOMMEDRAFT_169591 [Fomitiporia mediterranea MF3/22]